MQSALRTLVADDHPVYRDGLSAAVEADDRLELVAVCADGLTALEELARHEPDVAVVDLGLPGAGGREVIESAARQGIETRILVVSGHVDPHIVRSVLGAGAAGYLSKSARATDIAQAAVAVAEGQTVLGPEIQAALAEQFRGEEASGRHLLTAREVGVLRLLAQGLGAAQIGRELSISVTTVKSHLQHIYDKLGVATGPAAVSQAIRRGLLG
ncbi:MAG TPA: response regulator transcription factor [Solirubrobacteraceae bacterium]|nr:response regulator transcription factor [Solirubrobacteraceae bacterium]